MPVDDLISLREAIALANASDGADTITFDASLGAGGTIRLTNADGTLQVTDELTIDGDINDDGVADILITGDVNLGNDVTPPGTSPTLRPPGPWLSAPARRFLTTCGFSMPRRT